jgi:hypothetical protein
MLIAGSLLALLCGAANSAAAALEKREMMQSKPSARGLRLLVILVRRPWWLMAMALSFVAWVAEAGALGLAPVPVVTTLRSAGRGGLVLAGHRWLDERFGRFELLGVAMLMVGGALTTSSVASGHSTSPPLSALAEVAVAAVAIVAAAALAATTSSGFVTGSAVGILFVATGVFTKEIGDRVVRDGAAGLIRVLITPGPWLMVALSVWAISLLQHAFTRANAATVSAAATTVSANGLILAGALLYHQPLASGANIVPLTIGIVISALGALAVGLGGSDRSG